MQNYDTRLNYPAGIHTCFPMYRQDDPAKPGKVFLKMKCTCFPDRFFLLQEICASCSGVHKSRQYHFIFANHKTGQMMFGQ
jgi:hypothetical protein